MNVLDIVEQGLKFSSYRAAVLAGDAANASTPGFTPRDVAPQPRLSERGFQFAAAVREVGTRGPVVTVEYAMAKLAKNSVLYRALAAQERAVLREFRVVAEEERR